MTVIKCGGKSLPQLSQNFARFLKIWHEQDPLVLVHGGGPKIQELEQKLCISSSFNHLGQRITNKETLEVVIQSLCGSINSQLVSLLMAYGVASFGLSGLDGGLLQAKLKDYPILGWVGEIVKVRVEILHHLIQQGFVPVVAPLSAQVEPKNQGHGAAVHTPGYLGHPLNVNADDAASAIASAINARNMIFVSDIAGVLDSNKKMLPQINEAEIHEMVESGIICGGMIPKVYAALSVLKDTSNHVERIYIIDGTAEDILQEMTPSVSGDIYGRLKGTCIKL